MIVHSGTPQSRGLGRTCYRLCWTVRAISETATQTHTHTHTQTQRKENGPPPLPSVAPETTIRHVSLVPTLEQLGPGVRLWSDAVGVTNETENFTGQDRHMLHERTVRNLANDLAQMNHVQCAKAYCDLIRFLGVLFADLMRAMARAEEIVDEEVLLQTSVMTLNVAKQSVLKYEGELTKQSARQQFACVEGTIVEGGLAQEEDAISYMQLINRAGPMTIFASRLARLQAHFEGMAKDQRANIIQCLYEKLEKWREQWVMSLTSVSRDRADRLCALLVTYQEETTCVEDIDVEWAEARWSELVGMLAVDAVRAADFGPFRLPGTVGAIQVEDTQPSGASSSNAVLVKRAPAAEWEPATTMEMEELARHEVMVKNEEIQQAHRDEQLWQGHQAAAARDWDDWVAHSELERPNRMRPLKKFKVTVSVSDSEHNEIATTQLEGEVAEDDVPQVAFSVHTEIVQVPAQDEGDMDIDANRKEDGGEPVGGASRPDANQSDTEPVASVQEDVEAIDNALLDLDAIMESVMGRQWFQLCVEDQVDDDIIRRRWGPATLEVFQANRDMMELQAKEDYRKDKQVVDNEGQGVNVDDQQRDVKDELRVRPMSEDDDMSTASSGAKVFPRTIVVAGRRVDLEGECEARSIPGEDVAAAAAAAAAAADAVGSVITWDAPLSKTRLTTRRRWKLGLC